MSDDVEIRSSLAGCMSQDVRAEIVVPLLILNTLTRPPTDKLDLLMDLKNENFMAVSRHIEGLP